jgi:hypothetical protein
VTVTYAPECPDCLASIVATTDAGFRTVGGGASGVALVEVRCANPGARYRTEVVRVAVVTHPSCCGCGALRGSPARGRSSGSSCRTRWSGGREWP